jgi:hypothetical protein
MQRFDRDTVVGGILVLTDTEGIAIVSKGANPRQERRIPINSLYDASNFSIEKALVDFAITNKVLQQLDQPDKTKFTPCDEGMDIGDIVRDEDV